MTGCFMGVAKVITTNILRSFNDTFPTLVQEDAADKGVTYYARRVPNLADSTVQLSGKFCVLQNTVQIDGLRIPGILSVFQNLNKV